MHSTKRFHVQRALFLRTPAFETPAQPYDVITRQLRRVVLAMANRSGHWKPPRTSQPLTFISSCIVFAAGWYRCCAVLQCHEESEESVRKGLSDSSAAAASAASPLPLLFGAAAAALPLPGIRKSGRKRRHQDLRWSRRDRGLRNASRRDIELRFPRR